MITKVDIAQIGLGFIGAIVALIVLIGVLAYRNRR